MEWTQFEPPHPLATAPIPVGRTVAFWASDIQFIRGKVVEYYEYTKQYSVFSYGVNRLVHADDIWFDKD